MRRKRDILAARARIAAMAEPVGRIVEEAAETDHERANDALCELRRLQAIIHALDWVIGSTVDVIPVSPRRRRAQNP